MAVNLLADKGTPIDQQRFTWKDLVQKPISKMNVNAFTRVRIILMNGIESEAVRFGHSCARMNRGLQAALAKVRRKEQHQQTMVNWLLPADQSPLETTIGYEQVAVEVTAALARVEPDPYIAQVLRYGLLEDFDHLYRYSALLDRLQGIDANTITQGYTDIVPGRATVDEHRDPLDDLRNHYDKATAHPLTKLHANTIVAAEHQTHDYYMHYGPYFADPVARQLYAEIASIEEQHVTQYESMIDASESWIEKWLLHEANEVYNYYSCVQQEDHPRIKAIWERFLDYELGHLQFAMEVCKEVERRDPAEFLPEALPEPIAFKSNREYVRQVLRDEVDLRADGPGFVSKSQEPERSLEYRRQMNADGSPSDQVSAGWEWSAGGELMAQRWLKEAA
ncbi:MAG: hypothetical protein A4E19_13860 [Nitrospira sp. SG-bin1]|nr:MAG: hypothetical protein A4E19_13860 [Nitrospira sp. SG-bin1]